MKNKVIRLIIMVMCATQAYGCSRNDSIVSVSVQAFEKEIMSDSVQLLDVRTPAEYAEGHIEGAININVQSPDFTEKAAGALSKDLKVLVYCRSGRRSLTAAEILAGSGYKVVNLKGGIIDWEENGLKVTDHSIVGVYEDRNDGSKLTIVREKNGKFKVDVDLFRLTHLEGTGNLSDNRLTFSAVDASDNMIHGDVVVKGDMARFVITQSTWENLPVGTAFSFERI